MAEIHSLPNRLRYFFDRTIASGTSSLLLWIVAITFVIVALTAVLLSAGVAPTGEQSKGYGEAFWSTLNMALDPGAVSEPGWSYRALMLFVAILGILIVSTLIGILTSGIEGKLDDLRRGRSLVLESNHTLILGWSSKVGPIIRELIIANENRQDAVVVVLADKDKIEMEDDLGLQIGDKKSTRLICRRGSPSDLSSLEIVSPRTARSFIVLREESEDSDDNVVKVLLALRRIFGKPIPSAVVAELIEPTNADAAQRIDKQITVINGNDLVVRIIAQATCEPGISSVYEEILSFDGNEIYFQYEKSAEGMSFGEASMHFENSVIIGLRNRSGEVVINAPANRLVQEGEELIAIAEDDDRVIFSAIEQTGPNLNEPFSTKDIIQPPKKILIMGWNLQGAILRNEFEELLPPGSEVMLLFNKQFIKEAPDIEQESDRVKWTIRQGDTTNRKVLEDIDPTQFDHVIVLNYRDQLSSEKADSKTLLTLIHLRDMREEIRDFSITSEIIHARNRDLVGTQSDISDFVASEALVSKALAQLSENSSLKEIFDELLTANGCEFHLRPVNLYCSGSVARFSDISASALRRAEVAVGYRNDGVTSINPPKSASITFSEDATIIVIAEEM